LAKAEELPPADRSDHAWRGLAWTGGLFFLSLLHVYTIIKVDNYL
jgi:hypothetical protein